MKTVWKTWVILTMVALLPSLSGCVAVLAGAAGAGTVAWVQGRLDAALDANYDKAEKAVNQAITQMQFAKVSEKKDVLTAKLIARTAEDKKIEIKVSRVGEITSRVQIRVGYFGDEAQSLAILEKIKANL
jgi:Protein of unknown function (DUF3568)